MAASSLPNILIILTLLILYLQSPPSIIIIQGLMVNVEEEKTRLGSTPPTCHNKCNQCHPCMAVQASSLPSHHRFHPSPAESQQSATYYYNKYSNYKPLGWKCRCGDHFYNP